MSPFPQCAKDDWLNAKLRDDGKTEHRFFRPGEVCACNISYNCCAQAHVSVHSCDFTSGYFQEQENDRILLYRISVDGISEEIVTGGAMSASCVTVYDTKRRRTRIPAPIEEHVSTLKVP